MQVVHERCCGLDVHKKTVVACVLSPGQPRKELRTFGTMTDDLERLADWLGERGVTHAVLESTGSYWKPIWNILEERRFALVLANAAHVKATSADDPDRQHGLPGGERGGHGPEPPALRAAAAAA